MRKSLLIAISLVLLTWAAFWRVTQADFINYDDPDYLTENPLIQQGLTWDGIRWAFGNLHGHATYWHPLTWISHMIDVQLFGLNPLGHHLMNLLFHTLNAVLLFYLLRSLTASFWPSALVAAIFAIHPLQVESVAWVTERKTVLSAMFWILTIMAYNWYAQALRVPRRLDQETPSEAGDPLANTPAVLPLPRGEGWGEGQQRIQKASGVQLQEGFIKMGPALPRYLLALFLFTIGLMCKPVLVTLPLILLLLDYWPLRRFGFDTESRGTIKWLLIEKIPFLILAIASGLATVVGHQKLGSLYISRFPLEVRLENALVSYARYLGKAFWPYDLAVFYPHPGGWALLLVLLSVLILMGITIAAALLLKRKPAVFIGWLWFLVVLLPMIGIIQAGTQAMADRFMYLPLIGLALATVWLAQECTQLLPNLRLNVFLAAMALIPLSLTTFAQTGHWQNSVSLWRHTIAATRQNYVAYHNLGAALYKAGQRESAKEAVLQSIRISPKYAYARSLRGQMLSDEGRLDEAVAEFHAALEVAPDWLEVRLYLARNFSTQGKMAQAVAEYRKALQLQADFPLVLNNVAWILATSPDESIRNGADAVQFAQRACKLTDYEVGAYVGTLGAALAEAGQFEQAVIAAQKARDLALREGDQARAQKNIELANLFRSGKAYREPPR